MQPERNYVLFNSIVVILVGILSHFEVDARGRALKKASCNPLCCIWGLRIKLKWAKIKNVA